MGIAVITEFTHNFAAVGADIMICDAEQMRFSQLLFATAQGMIKKVDGKNSRCPKERLRLQNCRRKMCLSRYR